MQGWGDEFINFVGYLARHAQGNGCRTHLGVSDGVQEGLFKGVMGDECSQAAVGVEDVNGFAKLGVAESECRLAELHRDIDVDLGIVLSEGGDIR